MHKVMYWVHWLSVSLLNVAVADYIGIALLKSELYNCTFPKLTPQVSVESSEGQSI